MGLRAVAEGAGKGLVAGLAGTAAMTVSSSYEAKRRGRPPSTAPADAAAKVLGIEQFASDAAKDRFSNLVHWGYGTGWGAVRGVLGASEISPLAATAAHGAALYGSEQAMLASLGIAPPFWKWGVTEVGIDLLHHTVYVVATGVAYELLDR